MPHIPSIGSEAIELLRRTASRGFVSSERDHDPAAPARTNGLHRRDSVDLSDHARLLDRIRQLPEGRTELVDDVREAIEADRYVTNEKLDVAIDRLLEDLG